MERSCPICLETTPACTTSMQYPCGHTVCEDCYRSGEHKAATDSASYAMSKCPVCRHHVCSKTRRGSTAIVRVPGCSPDASGLADPPSEAARSVRASHLQPEELDRSREKRHMREEIPLNS